MPRQSLLSSKLYFVAISSSSLLALALAACTPASGGGGTPASKAAESPLPFPGLAKPAKRGAVNPEDNYNFNDDAKDSSTNPGTRAAKVATDDLVNSLSNKMSRSNEASFNVKMANTNAAQAIGSIESSIDDGTNVNLIVMRKDLSSVQLTGPVEDQMAIVKSQDLNIKTMATFKCLDANGDAAKSCRIASLDMIQEGGKSEVMAVIRHTSATFTVNNEKIPNVPSEDYKNLRAMLMAASTGSQTGSVVQSLFFDSSEVVNGETFVRISMVTNDNEVIGLKGNLKAVGNLKFTEGNLVKDIRPQSVKTLIPNASDIKSGWQAFVQSAQILRVDKASEFTLLLDVNGTDAEPRQTISLKITRENPAVIDLN